MSKATPFGSRSTADRVLAGVDLTRKRMVVTECNSCIGFATMKALSANGARVIGLARTMGDANAACAAAGRSLTPLECNATDLSSVDAAVQSIREVGPLDAVVINSPELQCFAEHAAQFALVNRLAELVRRGTGRIVIGSNDNANITGARAKDVLFANFQGARIYDSYAFDGHAALATALFAKELSRRLEVAGVLVNAFHSGAAVNLKWLEAPRIALELIQSVAGYFTKSPARRAATPALLAASPVVVGTTGEYWSNCQISRGNPLFSDLGLAKRLWEVSAQVIALAPGRSDFLEAARFSGDSPCSRTR
jgi:NAD(P)-dependent dehydrogenase (short-subunit alcohol dehydrogenase family)